MKKSNIYLFIKSHIVEVLVGGGVILQGYNMAFEPWSECVSPTSGLAGLPSLKPSVCSNVQSPELLFIAIVMIVIGVAIYFNGRKKS